MRIALAFAVALLATFAAAQDGWRLDNPSALWLPRDSHTVTVFNGRMWLLNGYGGVSSGAPRDAWSSADGHWWDLEVNELPWRWRTGHSAPVFDGRLWVIGGWSEGDYKNDVWSSYDGVNWVEETPSAQWGPRTLHDVVVFDGRMWVVGGAYAQASTAIQLFNDVWSSTDGINWTFEGAGPWSHRFGHACVSYDGRIWLTGGFDFQDYMSDVWSSADGMTWVEETVGAPWAPRASHSLEVFKDRVWIVGGAGRAFASFSDVWSSSDGANWTQETLSAPWGRRSLHESVVFKNRLWVMGGASNGTKNDVWSYGLHVRPDVLPDGIVGQPYSATLEAREGDGPFVWALTGGSLPPGLALDTSTTAATLPITGTPSQVGTFNFTIHLTDDNGYTNEQEITIQINPPPPLKSESSSSGCALQHIPIPAWLLLPAAVAWFRRRRRLPTT